MEKSILRKPATMNWGPVNQFHRELMQTEIFRDKVYEKFFEVESGDVVLDVGAGVGPFTYSILDKNPAQVICLEPSSESFNSLLENTLSGPVTCVNAGISNVNGLSHFDAVFFNRGSSICDSITFDQLLLEHNLDKIDFIKTDCEGGEYEIFNDKFLPWIKANVRKISGEWHLSSPSLKEKFRKFRDTYLTEFKNYRIMSVDGVDIAWDLWNEHFIEYYTEVIVHIDNRN